MTQMVLNIEDASLVPSLKQILQAIKGVTIDRLATSCSSTVDAEKQYITETITVGYRQAKEKRFAGANLSSLDGLIAELRAEAT